MDNNKYIKLKYNDVAYILNHRKRHTVEKYFSSWYVQNDLYGNGAKIICKINLLFLALIFIPVCIFQFFFIIWNEGLKNYYIPLKIEFTYNLRKYDDSRFKRLQEVYEKYGIIPKKDEV